MQTDIRLTAHIAQLLLEWEMFRANVMQNKTHFILNYFFENRAVCEIMCSNTADRGTKHMTM